MNLLKCDGNGSERAVVSTLGQQSVTSQCRRQHPNDPNAGPAGVGIILRGP